MEFLSHKNNYVKLCFLREREREIYNSDTWMDRVEKYIYHPSRKPGSLLGGGAAYCGGAITGGPW